MGESDLSGKTFDPRHKSGDFHPTPYGRTLLPRVTGVLSAEMALVKHTESEIPNWRQLSPETLEPLLRESEAGRALTDAGRVLKEVQVRGPDGKPVEFGMIAFCDIDEFRRVSLALGTHSLEQLMNLAEGTPAFTVSLLLRHNAHSRFAAGRLAKGRRYEN